MNQSIFSKRSAISMFNVFVRVRENTKTKISRNVKVKVLVNNNHKIVASIQENGIFFKKTSATMPGFVSRSVGIKYFTSVISRNRTLKNQFCIYISPQRLTLRGATFSPKQFIFDPSFLSKKTFSMEYNAKEVVSTYETFSI